MSRRKRYSAVSKRGVLRRANDVLVAEELGINARQPRRWRDATKRDGEKAFQFRRVGGEPAILPLWWRREQGSWKIIA